MQNLTADVIEKMNYNELIGVVGETNRPPGGRRSIVHILNNTFVNKESKVLDIGTSTGTTALEIARLTHSNVIGVDINEMSLEQATERAKKLELQNVTFRKEDVTNLSFFDNMFDLIFCGNVLSIVNDNRKAFHECIRVTKSNGFLAVIPMYYIKTPSEIMVNKVREAIQVNIPVLFRDDVVNLYDHDHLEVFMIKDYMFDDINEKIVKNFVMNILQRSHLDNLNLEAKKMLEEKYLKSMLLFRENLSHMGYSIIILRKTNYKEDPELFTSSVIIK